MVTHTFKHHRIRYIIAYATTATLKFAIHIFSTLAGLLLVIRSANHRAALGQHSLCGALILLAQVPVLTNLKAGQLQATLSCRLQHSSTLHACSTDALVVCHDAYELTHCSTQDVHVKKTRVHAACVQPC